MSESTYSRRQLADFSLDRHLCLKPALQDLIRGFFLVMPDAESRADAYYALLAWWSERRPALKARKGARAVARRKQPRIRLIATRPDVERTEPTMPRAALRIVARSTPAPVQPAVTASTIDDSPEAA